MFIERIRLFIELETKKTQGVYIASKFTKYSGYSWLLRA